MSVKIIEKPPDGFIHGRTKIKKWSCRNKTNSASREIKGTFSEQLAINQNIGMIEGTLRSLNSCRIEGQLELVILSTTTILSGELTTYDPASAKQRDELLHLVTKLSTSLSEAAVHCLGEVRITFSQTCEFEFE